ncbi:MAG: hydrogenase maturation nickel metallochaperone HypA [Lachnospiraceae bacterium]|nr:hydrogenase maturation nickel metallochaperone HypA [Lachnospiraceae bacterium]
MSYIVAMIDIALNELKDRPQAVPKRLVIEVGQMTGVMPEYLHKYFPIAAKGTRLSDASLEVISIPVQVQCAHCGSTYRPEKAFRYLCPVCGEKAATLLHGRECKVKSIEVEE